jgi:hypothetical protein
MLTAIECPASGRRPKKDQQMTNEELISRVIPHSRNPYEPANEPPVPHDCVRIPCRSLEWVYYTDPAGDLWRRYAHTFAGRDESRTIYNAPERVVLGPVWAELTDAEYADIESHAAAIGVKVLYGPDSTDLIISAL